MEFFKDLNVLEILKKGAIGLGFLLALMSFNLIRKEQEKPKPSNTVLKSAKGFMIFSAILMTLGIISEFIKAKPTLRVRLGNNEVELNPIAHSSLSSLDTKDYFINSEYDFAFKKPNKDWSDIQSDRGVAGLYKLMAIKSELITQNALEEALKRNPLAPMVANASYFSFYNPKSKKDIVTTDSTGNDLIDAMVEKRSKELSDTSSFLRRYSTTEADFKREFDTEIKNYRKNLVLFDTLGIRDGFVLSVFPKDSLPSYLRNLKLPAFYTYLTSALGLTSDKLAADNNQILGGAEITLKNIKLDNKVGELQSKKWMMFTENDKFFFTIELSFYPQVSASIDLWDELRETLNSFTILTKK